MAPGLTARRERRTARRARPEDGGWHPAAVLRPGLRVQVLDLGAGGARVASPRRLKPGARAELRLAGAAPRALSGHISRCRVTHLRPLLFEGVVVFDELLDG